MITTRHETPYSWFRLGVALLASMIGGVGMWSVIVILPAIEAEFGVSRADASLPYTLTMLGFAIGGVVTGRMADKRGVLLPLGIGTIAMASGYALTAIASNIWQVAIIQCLLIAALGSSASFGPLIADTSYWFRENRGVAVAICASGNYLAGTIWPPIIQHFVATEGWRTTHIGIAVFCILVMPPILLLLRRPSPIDAAASTSAGSKGHTLGMPPNVLQLLLGIAGVACCVAMSMPQVHIVAYCGDLGYGVARGAEMLSLMLGFGVISRVASGFVADRIGGLATLLLGSVLQGSALLLYLLFDGLTSLYVISALFGLFQGGIVPSYAVIVREYFPPREAGTRVGIAMMTTLIGMALGGWISGAIFDWTGSYAAAFANGLAWNLSHGCLVAWLLMRSRRPMAPTVSAA